jgi:hypothetical protein
MISPQHILLTFIRNPTPSGAIRVEFRDLDDWARVALREVTLNEDVRLPMRATTFHMTELEYERLLCTAMQQYCGDAAVSDETPQTHTVTQQLALGCNSDQNDCRDRQCQAASRKGIEKESEDEAINRQDVQQQVYLRSLKGKEKDVTRDAFVLGDADPSLNAPRSPSVGSTAFDEGFRYQYTPATETSDTLSPIHDKENLDSQAGPSRSLAGPSRIAKTDYTAGKPYETLVCDICHARIAGGRASLIRHTKRHAQQRVLWVCTIATCGKHFSRNEKGQRHRCEGELIAMTEDEYLLLRPDKASALTRRYDRGERAAVTKSAR